MGLTGYPFGATLIRVRVAGRDLSMAWRPVVISLSTRDRAGLTSDSCRVVLDDTGGRLPLPEGSDRLQIGLGRAEGGIADVFDGFVADARSQGDRGGGASLVITGRGADPRGKGKEPRQRHWDETTLGAVMADVGTLAELDEVHVHESLAGIARPWWGMDGESPIAFGRRLAAELGATFKIIGRRGVLVPRSAGVSASGRPLTEVVAERPGNLIGWDLSPITTRPRRSRVRGRWYDHDAARWREREATVEGIDEEEGGQALAFASADETEAGAAASAEAGESERGRGGGRATILGDARPRPEARCRVAGVRAGIDGTWTIEEVSQSVERGQQGWTTALDLVRPETEGG